MSDDRPAVYLEGNTVIYRASAIGGCPRALYAARSDMTRLPIPQIVQQGMDEGTSLEPTILDLLREKHGWEFMVGSRQLQIELRVGNISGREIIVRGKFDDLGNPPGQPTGPVDVKAFTPEQCALFDNKGFIPFPRYAWQQSIYGLASPPTHTFYMPIFNKGTWTIEPWSLVPYTPMYTFQDLKARVLTLERSHQSQSLPEECPQDFACQYPYLHDGPPKPEPPASSLPIIQSRIRISQKIKDLELLRQALDQLLKLQLEPDTSYASDGYTITVYPNPNRFNTAHAKRILREADIDYESDPEFTIPGKGTQVRFSKSTRGAHPPGTPPTEAPPVQT